MSRYNTIQSFNYISLKTPVHNWMLLTMLGKGLAVRTCSVMSVRCSDPLIHHSISPHLRCRPQITSSYHLLIVLLSSYHPGWSCAVKQWNFLKLTTVKLLDESFKYESLFHFSITSTKKYISIVSCGLYYFTVQNISAKVKEALLASNSKSHYTKCHLFQLLHFSTLQMIRKILFYWAFQKCSLYTVHVYV